MKQQTLITSLAVLLAVSLSAIVVLVISSDGLGARQTAADAPASIEVQLLAPTAESADAVAEPAPTADPESTSTAPAPTTPAEPAPSAEPAPTTAGEPTAEPEPTPTTPAEPEPTPTTPAEPTAEPTPATGEPPCDGTIVDGECIDISILCLLGYERVGDQCVFVGCPFGYALHDGFCQEFELALPCADGFVRLDDGTCVLDAVVLDPSLLQPLLCGEGFAWVDGECTTVCPPDHHWTNGFCLPAFGFDIADLSAIDLGAVLGT